MTAAGLEAFEGQQYLNLKSYRKNGKAVQTPVWFAVAASAQANTSPANTFSADTFGANTVLPNTADARTRATIYVYTTANSGKVKRIRRTAAIRIAPCDARGNIIGAWLSAHAEVVSGNEFISGMRLLNRKYWPWKQALDLGLRLFSRHQRAMLVIHPI